MNVHVDASAGPSAASARDDRTVAPGDLALRTGLVSLILLAFAVRILAAPLRRFDSDEFEHLHNAFSIHNGLVQYRDYFECHTPWLPYVLQWAYAVWGAGVEAILAARYLMLVPAAALLFMTYRLGALLYGTNTGLVGALMLSYTVMFFAKSIEVRPDSIAASLSLGALCLLVRGVREASAARCFAAGLAIGSAIMFTQKTLFALPGFGLALAWWFFARRDGPRQRSKLTCIALFGIGVALPIVATTSYFFAHGALHPFIEYDFLMTGRWRTRFPPNTFIAWHFRDNPLIATLGCLGLLAATVQIGQRSRSPSDELVPLLVTYTLIAGLWILPVPHRQYFLQFLPLLSIYGARHVVRTVEEIRNAPSPRGAWNDPRLRLTMRATAGALILVAVAFPASFMHDRRLWSMLLLVVLFALVFREVWQRASRALRKSAATTLLLSVVPLAMLGQRFLVAWVVVGCAIALALSIPRWLFVTAFLACGGLLYPLAVMHKYSPNAQQLAQVRYILRHSAPHETVFDGWTGIGVLRPHAYFFPFLHGELQAMLDEKQRGMDVVDALERSRARFVLYDRSVYRLGPEVQVYIRRHYRPTRVGVIHERVDSLD